MKRLYIACLLAVASLNAHAVGRLADVSVIDRDTGAAIATHYYKEEYWITGKPGAHYAIAIRNRLGGRILAVTAVDGVNVITGDTAWSSLNNLRPSFRRLDRDGGSDGTHVG